MKKLIVICAITGELLVGVKAGDKYTNFDGEVEVTNSVKLELVSYEPVKIFVDRDTVIQMVPVK